MREHESEPIPGLPEKLPDGERILWQGAPSSISLGNKALHLKGVGTYLVLIVAWGIASAFGHHEATLGAVTVGAKLCRDRVDSDRRACALCTPHGPERALYNHRPARRDAVRRCFADDHEYSTCDDRIGGPKDAFGRYRRYLARAHRKRPSVIRRAVAACPSLAPDKAATDAALYSCR